jgi:hypothetical protein
MIMLKREPVRDRRGAENVIVGGRNDVFVINPGTRLEARGF